MNAKMAIVTVEITKKCQNIDIEVPLDISANDLVLGLNKALELGIDTEKIQNCFLKSENPIALLKGNKSLREFGIHNGTIILFSE